MAERGRQRHRRQQDHQRGGARYAPGMRPGNAVRPGAVTNKRSLKSHQAMPKDTSSKVCRPVSPAISPATIVNTTTGRRSALPSRSRSDSARATKPIQPPTPSATKVATPAAATANIRASNTAGRGFQKPLLGQSQTSPRPLAVSLVLRACVTPDTRQERRKIAIFDEQILWHRDLSLVGQISDGRSR